MVAIFLFKATRETQSGDCASGVAAAITGVIRVGISGISGATYALAFAADGSAKTIREKAVAVINRNKVMALICKRLPNFA